MSRISDIINEYFIDMVKNPQTKEELSNRLHMTEEERSETPLPHSYSAIDALYVDLGCRFQDNPLKSIFLAFAFITMIGVMAAQYILSLIN